MFSNKRLSEIEAAIAAAQAQQSAVLKELSEIRARLETLDPQFQRAISLKTTQEVAFMMDRFEELATKILQRESATKRWSKAKEQEEAQLDFLRNLAQQQQTPAPAPAPAPIKANGVR
jgi:flagellar hook-associated protein FlgK